jgi:hypothetical protein
MLRDYGLSIAGSSGSSFQRKLESSDFWLEGTGFQLSLE